jgi:hypothetical protein
MGTWVIFLSVKLPVIELDHSISSRRLAKGEGAAESKGVAKCASH